MTTAARKRAVKKPAFDPETMCYDEDARPVPRLDRLPVPEAAKALGISTEQLESLLDLGFKLFGPFSGMNNCLLTPEELSKECRISTRQLRNLEERGLPVTGSRLAKRYPWPLAEHWYWVFKHRTEQNHGRTIPHLDPLEAETEYSQALLLIRAYNWIRLRNEQGELDEASRARLPEAREYIRRNLRPPYWSCW